MSTAHWTFLLSFLILVKVVADPGACADLLFEKDGFLLCKKDTAAAACKSEATVVFATTWCSAAIEHPASADSPHSQQAPFKGSHVPTSSPCGLQRHHGTKATIVALCCLSCCDERHLPQMLEVWPGVGTVQRSILYSSRSTWASLQSAPSATSTLGWPAVAQFKLWFLESEDTHKALIQSRTEKGKGNGTWQDGDQMSHPKGQGKGMEHHAPAQTPLPPFMPYPMMPQYPQQMMPAPLPPPLTDKGAGKTKNSPVMMPMMPVAQQGAMTSAVPTMPWGTPGQMMAPPVAPTGSMATSSVETSTGHKPDGPAQQKLNRLLKEMKKEEDNLSPHLQAIAHEMQKQGEKNNIKNLSSAVKALGDAKQDLLEAENARAQLLSQWKSFLQQSVVKWREFTANFQASESAHQQGVQAAKLEVRRAQRAFDLASKREQPGKEDTVDISDEEEDTEVIEEAMEDPHNESVQRIHQGHGPSIVTSLEELSSSADQLDQRVKRPRTSGAEGDAGGSHTQPHASPHVAQPPFGGAGAV